jgi:hypothetical protein
MTSTGRSRISLEMPRTAVLECDIQPNDDSSLPKDSPIILRGLTREELEDGGPNRLTWTKADRQLFYAFLAKYGCARNVKVPDTILTKLFEAMYYTGEKESFIFGDKAIMKNIREKVKSALRYVLPNTRRFSILT